MVFSRALVLQSNQTLNCVTISFWGHNQQQYSQGVRIAPGKKTVKDGSHLEKLKRQVDLTQCQSHTPECSMLYENKAQKHEYYESYYR
jgi:hypothetical protein